MQNTKHNTDTQTKNFGVYFEWKIVQKCKKEEKEEEETKYGQFELTVCME